MERQLRAMPGIAEVNALEGPPDLMVISEAPTREELVQSIAALIAVEDDTCRGRCLPVQADRVRPAAAVSRRNSKGGGG